MSIGLIPRRFMSILSFAFSKVKKGRLGTPAYHGIYSRTRRKGVAALHESRIAALICRARRMRLLELSFLTWAEQSAVYKPVIVDGKTTAPKRMRDEFENDSGLRGCDIRL